jgi:hypothetical protein
MQRQAWLRLLETLTVKLLITSDLSFLSNPIDRPPSRLINPSQGLAFYSCSILFTHYSATVMLKAVTTKRQRASQACDFCHARGLRCRRNAIEEDDGASESTGCLTCKDYGVICTANRPMKKRGRKPQVMSSDESELQSTENQDIMSLQTIHKLVRIYRDTMFQC